MAETLESEGEKRPSAESFLTSEDFSLLDALLRREVSSGSNSFELDEGGVAILRDLARVVHHCAQSPLWALDMT